MIDPQTDLFRKWLRDQLVQLVNVQRCQFGHGSAAGAPVREADLVVYLWAGIVIHIHLLDEPIKTNRARKIIESATEIGVPTLFIINRALLPKQGEVIPVDRWYIPFQTLIDDRAYAFSVENNTPRLQQVQFRPLSRYDLTTHIGVPLNISRLRHFRNTVRSNVFKGAWLLADFESDQSSNAPPITRTDYAAYQYKGPRMSFQDMPQWEKANLPGSNFPPQKSKLDLAYETLGLLRSATRDEVRAAFRKLAFEVHPDVSTLPKGEAEARFKMLTEAYEFIRTAQGW